MTTAAFKVKLKTYLFTKKHSVQRCEQRMLEQRYKNVTIIIIMIRLVKGSLTSSVNCK